ncbi:uncharacterized protein LOC112348099 [Selaginella moellendorffii]|uniref:uncharacterized protein LOC112348099 n=1 Tax=Selaginella moellendorffii TaxID=88036 RepID=UPI000D1CA0A8|nr:uncharacterized protein LOC112348099 [Selaginella moellendorffii]|eukprot:XP_024535928.1 uncharacterized protein LOC112348099 [Selaginella moellendorffii]
MASFSLFLSLLFGLSSLAAAFHRFEDSGASAIDSARMMLRKYNLPEELFPVSLVTHFSFDKEDRAFHMRFETSCYVKVSDEYLWYGEEVNGRVMYGRMEDLTGVQSKVLLVWLPVRELRGRRGERLRVLGRFLGSGGISIKMRALCDPGDGCIGFLV